MPRSGPRVRVPSRAFLLRTGNFDLQGFLFFCCSVKVDYGLLFKTVRPEVKIFSLSILFIIKQAGIDSIPANVFLNFHIETIKK